MSLNLKNSRKKLICSCVRAPTLDNFKKVSFDGWCCIGIRITLGLMGVKFL